MTSEQNDSEQPPDRSHLEEAREKQRNEILAACLEDSVLAGEVAAFSTIICIWSVWPLQGVRCRLSIRLLLPR
jgi:hypothetical protein